MGIIQEENLGQIKISDEVIIICATNATKKVKGVRDLSTTLTDSISKSILGKEPVYKGIKLSRSDEGITLDISVIVDYMVKIPQLAWEIQSKVKNEIEEMTALKVLSINIHVQGVADPEEE